MKKIFTVFASLIIIFDAIWTAQMLFIIEPQVITPAAHIRVPSFADRQLAKMSLKQKVSSLFILHTSGTDLATLSDYLATYQPGGIIFMGDNIPDTIDELKLLTDGLQSNKLLPYIFAVDEEGGTVKRLTDDIYQSAIELKNLPADATAVAFDSRSLLLRQSGLNLNFGIVADVTADTNSFIYPRVFGGNPLQVGEKVSAAVTASKGLSMSTLKHFPGHGETAADSHGTIPTTDISFEQWQLKDQPPFQMGIDAGADVIMFGHLRYSSVDDVPASLSTTWHNILKDQLGFNGLVVTDDMMMLQNSGESEYSNPVNNAVEALKAGNTMLVYVLGYDNMVSDVSIDELIEGIVTAVKDGRLGIDIINHKVLQVINFRRSLIELL